MVLCLSGSLYNLLLEWVVDDLSNHGHDISSCIHRKVKGSEMLWYPQTLLFIFHGHVAVQMRDSQLLYAKDTDQLKQGIPGEYPAQPLLEAEAAAAGCSEQCPAGFSVSWRMETPQAHQSVFARVWPASPQESFFPLYFVFVPRAHTSLRQMCAVPCMGEWHRPCRCYREV